MANELLEKVWERTKEVANQEREMLIQFVESHEESLGGGLQAWDWRYYAEKVRKKPITTRNLLPGTDPVLQVPIMTNNNNLRKARIKLS